MKTFHFKCIGLAGKAVSDILNGTTSQWFCSSCDKTKSKSKVNLSARTSISNIQLDYAAFTSPNRFFIRNSTIKSNFSDYSFIVSEISLPNNSVTKYTNVTRSFTDYGKVNAGLLIAFDPLNRPVTNDVNSLHAYFDATLQSELRKFTTVQTKRCKTIHLQCKYMNSQLAELIRQRDNLFKKFKKRRNNVRLRNKIDLLDVSISRLQQYYKEIYYEDRFRGCDNPKKVWKNINALLGRDKKKDELVIRDNDSVFVDKTRVAQCLNDHFASIGSKLSEKFPPKSKDSINKYESLTVSPRSIFFDPVVDCDVIRIISSMDDNKAPGVDDLTVVSQAFSSHCCAISL